MLPWTTRTADGLLGHALEAGEELRIDRTRRVVRFEPRWSETDQHLTLVSEASSVVGAEAGTFAAKAGVAAAEVTHVAWYLHVQGYLEVPGDKEQYEVASSCCLLGQVSETCGDWYVTRVIWGSGRVQLLHRLEASAHVDAVELVSAHGGTSYRVLNEMTFDKAFFAYEVSPLAALCRTVAPGEEMAPLSVAAPDNCWVHIYAADGTRSDTAEFFPEQGICRKVAAMRCAQVTGALHCSGSYNDGTQTLTFASEPSQTAVPSAVPAMEPRPGGEVPVNPSPPASPPQGVPGAAKPAVPSLPGH
jgi:hypothetical protein